MVNMTIVNINGSSYIKEQVDACFSQQALYTACQNNYHLKIIGIAIFILFLLLIIIQIYKTYKRTKPNI